MLSTCPHYLSTEEVLICQIASKFSPGSPNPDVRYVEAPSINWDLPEFQGVNRDNVTRVYAGMSVGEDYPKLLLLKLDFIAKIEKAICYNQLH